MQMTLGEIAIVISIFLGGGGIFAWVLNLRKELREQGKTKREKIVEEELIEEKGAALLVTTSSQAIAVFKIALERANGEAERLRQERDDERREKEESKARIRDLEGRVSYLEARVRELGG